MNARIAILGAGISGLSAGYELVKAGFNPTIFERESFPGGRMSSEEVDGFIVEKAAYTFPEYHKNLMRFLGELGMEDSLVQTPGTSSTFTSGEEHRIKIGSPKDFLRYKLLSVKNKKDMVKLFLYAQSLGKALNLANPSEKTFELEKESASQYLLRNYDEAILEYIAYPLFCEIFLGTPEHNSKLAFLATLKNLTRFKIFSFHKGMGMLPKRLMNHLDVRLNTPVLRVCSRGRKGPYKVHIGGLKPESLTFDAVIFAIPLPLVPGIIDKLPSTVKSSLKDIQYAPSVVVALAVDKRYTGGSMINNLVRKYFSIVGTVVLDHLKGPDRIPGGKGLITAILTEHASRAWSREAEHIIVNGVLKEVESLFPGLSDNLIFSRVYRWEHGAVQLQPGALLKQDSALRALEHQFHDIYFAGDGLHRSSLEASFNSGIRAAHLIIERMGTHA